MFLFCSRAFFSLKVSSLNLSFRLFLFLPFFLP
ncbi:hypothetical protein BE25_0110 [Staphylococcus phage vB_SepM_BE25]|nr:hypothetical protein BE24_0084 [Staphylococcus phage vB_SepM_BE24]WEU70596.1 hypothetical protein BE25_0110 [Staphylococcus phage vB_SepM_BE25]